MSRSHPPSLAEDPTGRAERLRGLMAQVATGDSEAFATVYDEVSGAVYGTAVRVLRDRDHAAEVMQEVMVEAWRTAPRFDDALGSVPAWFATLAHRRAVDRVRSVQAQRDRDQRLADRSYEPAWDSVAEEVENRAERRQLGRCLGALTSVQRDAVQRTYYDGLTYRQAAEQAQVAVPTMKSRIRDALRGLRRCLEEGP